MVVIRSALTPRLERKSLADVARLSPSARLYSSLPRSSQWPMIVNLMSGLVLRKSAFVVRTCDASGRIFDLSKSKKASFTFVPNSSSSEGPAGGGGGGGDGGTVTVTRAVHVIVPPGPVAVIV